MNKYKEIRPVVLGIAIRDNKLLVGEGYNKVTNQTFYRCLGGGIEFLENSSDALKREFKEEIDANIIVKDFLGISENIFSFEGNYAHELILFYSIDIRNEDYREEYVILDSDTNRKVMWVDIEDFNNNNKILYPKEVFKWI